MRSWGKADAAWLTMLLPFPILIKLEGVWAPPEVTKLGLGVGLERSRWLSDPWQDEEPALRSGWLRWWGSDPSSRQQRRAPLPGSSPSPRSQ